MFGLPEEATEKFRKGLHVVRNSPGFFNGIWSDMLIETTYMKFGSSPGGLVGITLNPKAVFRWAYSFHKLSTMIKDLKEINEESSSTDMHKEEYEGRMKSDLEDRMKIRKKLSGCINPLTETGGEFFTGIVNIASGKVTPSSKTNVYDLKTIGSEQLNQFRASLPTGFNDAIQAKIVTAAKKAKRLKSADGKRETRDVGAIFNRLLLMSNISNTPIDMKEVLKYELTPMPLSMFKIDGSPRICKSKSDLMNGLKVAVPTRGKAPDMSIVDGCAILWKIQWPSANGNVQDFVLGFLNFISEMLRSNDVSLIFDRYYDYSIKSVTRENRNVVLSSKQVKVTLLGPAHDRNVVLTNKSNKVQLINLLVESLRQLRVPIALRKLIVTGPDPVPLEVSATGVRNRNDLTTLQEEADTIIVSHMLSMVNEGYRRIQVICEDTDVFVLLVHHYDQNDLSSIEPSVDVLMQYPPSAPKAISILQTINSLPSNVVSSVLAAHVLSGCDTVPQLFGIGKKVIKLLKAKDNHEYDIEHLGNTKPDIPWENIENGCINFICGLYGSKTNKKLSEMRYSKFVEKSKANTMTSVSDLEKFPPTLEAARLNIKRAHYQSSIWRNLRLDIVADTVHTLEAEQFGWVKDSTNKCLDPLFLDPTTPIAPDNLLKITFCGCCCGKPCSTQRCGCQNASVKCGMLCKCKGECCNGAPLPEEDSGDLAIVDEVNGEDSGDEGNDEDEHLSDDEF